MQKESSIQKECTPAILEVPGRSFPPPTVPVEHKVIGVGGSHIDVDRHMPAHSYLINTGLVSLDYGPTPSAVMRNDPSLYFENEEIFITDLKDSKCYDEGYWIPFGGGSYCKRNQHSQGCHPRY